MRTLIRVSNLTIVHVFALLEESGVHGENMKYSMLLAMRQQG